MAINNFEDLVAWQKIRIFVKDAYDISGKFPENEKFGLTNQFRRSSVSVISNIAEGWARKSTADFIRFLNIALGSLSEAETQLIIAFDLNFINNGKLNIITEQITEISKIINGLIASLKNTKN